MGSVAVAACWMLRRRGIWENTTHRVARLTPIAPTHGAVKGFARVAMTPPSASPTRAPNQARARATGRGHQPDRGRAQARVAYQIKKQAKQEDFVGQIECCRLAEHRSQVARLNVKPTPRKASRHDPPASGVAALGSGVHRTRLSDRAEIRYPKALSSRATGEVGDLAQAEGV
jgi:hypothetical protein